MERALQWVRGLQERDFVGTESRLNTIFDLLRQIVFGTEADPAAKIEELRRQQRTLDDEIARIEAGEATMLDPSGVRDRYQQFAATARELLADFRQVEENFRKLDRQLREKVAGWQGGKGELLDDVLGSRESITGSDQGRSFQAFYDFLLSQARQQELSDLLDRVHQLSGNADSDPRLRHVHHDWLQAAEAAQATVRQLSEQLRRFLDDQVWFENRRVIDLLRDIEARALSLRDEPRVDLTMELDALAPERHGCRWNGRCIPPSASRASTATRSGPRAATTRPIRLPSSSRSTSTRARCAATSAPRSGARPQVGLADLVSAAAAHPRHRGARHVPVASRRRLHDRLRRHQFRAGQLDRPRRPRPGPPRCHGSPSPVPWASVTGSTP